MKPTVAIGMIGSNLDAGAGRARWEHWRPTITLCTQPDLILRRLELIHQRDATKTVDTIIEDLKVLSPETVVTPHEINLQNPWDFEEVYEALFDFSRGYHFSPDEEEYVIHITTGTHVAQICMFLLVESRYLPGRLIQTSPPKGADSGPGDYTIIDLDLSRYDAIATRFQREQREGVSFLKGGIETQNASFNRLIEQIERVAIASKSPILLSGPTGAGKTLLARKIFELKKSKRQVEGEFVEINCATLRGDTAMSMLFGHKRGAFTGAQNDREGLLRRAHKGLLFLDEIGELGLDEQAMLLRAIEEKRFLPVGADRESTSEFQLIAGTNRDLLQSVQQGAFREDLWARINLWSFRLPGLKERPEDITPNFDFELQKVSRDLGKQITINKEARQKFLQFAKSSEGQWVGNFRDLNAAVTRMATLCHAGRISLQDVEEELLRLQKSWGSTQESAARPPVLEELLGAPKLAALDPFDVPQLLSVVEVCKQAKTLSEAGRILFASSRTQKSSSNDADRLRKYLARFGLSWEQVK